MRQTVGRSGHAVRRYDDPMPRLDRIYTKTGDEGMTGLGGGRRVPKDSPAGRDLRHGRRAEFADRRRARARPERAPTAELAHRSRTSCSTSAPTCAGPSDDEPARHPVPTVEARHIEKLERLIDEFNEVVGPLTNFLLPGGSPGAAQLHVARTICRRAEREAIDPRPRRADRPTRAPLPQPAVGRAVRDGPLREPRARRRRTALAARRSDVAHEPASRRARTADPAATGRLGSRRAGTASPRTIRSDATRRPTLARVVAIGRQRDRRSRSRAGCGRRPRHRSSPRSSPAGRAGAAPRPRSPPTIAARIVRAADVLRRRA